MSTASSGSGITSRGKGSYTIEGLDTDSPRILVSTSSTASNRVSRTAGGGMAHIILVPLDPNSNECGSR
jgi:hypothetical protein